MNSAQRPERFDEKRYGRLLETRSFGRHLVYVEEIDSTQRLAAELAARDAAEGDAVLSELQTAGRGRMGRTWHSPPGKGLWCSIILRPSLPLSQAPLLTFLAAVAVCRSIRRSARVPAMIKWPNDILVDGKKVCGILLESHAEGEQIRHVVAGIGIGVNLEKSDYPADLASIATSLRIEAGRPIDREALLADLMKELENLYELFLAEGFQPIRALWEALNCTVGKRIQVRDASGFVEGTAEGMDPDGGLVVRLSDGGAVKLFSGEIQHAEPAEKPGSTDEK
jgi:BirA family biotin operon repressor/biotin-[acetyl-CoA-carboxylase] ligase